MLTAFFTIWALMAVIGIILAIAYWATDPAYYGSAERKRELQVGAIIFLAALVAPLTIVGLVIYGLIWLVRTALGK